MEFLSVEQVAQQLGVSEKTVRNYINSGELKAYKLGTKWRIEPQEVERYIKTKSNVQDAQEGDN